MLISPPDSVLAEAGRMSPRPSIASTLQVGEPTQRIAWWVERRLLNPGSLSRFNWMLETAGGHGWLIFDPEDEGLSLDDVHQALAPTNLRWEAEFRLPSGDIAVPVAPA